MRTPNGNDVVVLGVGVVSALGDTAATWSGLCSGETAIRMSAPDVFAARVDDPTLDAELPRALDPQVKFLSGSGRMSAMATQAAWIESASDDIPDVERGLYLAQMDAEDWNCNDFRNAAHAASDALPALSQVEINRASPRHVKPFFLLEGLKNNAFSFLATWFELRGANTSTAGCTSLGATLLDMGRRAIQHGALRRAVVAGAARLSSETALFELEQQALRTPLDGTQPAPLTTASAGLVPGDAAATLVLAPIEDAPEGAVTILGVGAATCLLDSLAARRDALQRAADQALRQAGVEPGELTAVVAPGSGLEAERAALADLPGAAAQAPVVCWAGALGYTALAAGTTGTALATLALRNGEIPPARIPSGASAQLPTLRDTPVPAPAGSAILVLSLGTFGHAGAVVLRS